MLEDRYGSVVPVRRVLMQPFIPMDACRRLPPRTSAVDGLGFPRRCRRRSSSEVDRPFATKIAKGCFWQPPSFGRPASNDSSQSAPDGQNAFPERQRRSGCGLSCPPPELTVSAPFRSSRCQGDLCPDDRSQGTADIARRRRAATTSSEQQLNRCRRHPALKADRMSAAQRTELALPTQRSRSTPGSSSPHSGHSRVAHQAAG